jgi:enamine deaminase RidA (YjgF/YER057c/UK114 family)
MGYADVVQATVYMGDLNDFAAMNAVYGEFFKDDPPARATVGVLGLPKDARVEMAFVAVKN